MRNEMTEGIKRMKELGFIKNTVEHYDDIVRQFVKYDDDGNITDTINYFYNKETGVKVFTNDLQYGWGTKLNNDLLNAVVLNFNELNKLFEYSNTGLPSYDEIVEVFTKAFDSLTKESDK